MAAVFYLFIYFYFFYLFIHFLLCILLMSCGAFEGQLITSILGDRSERRGDDSTFPELRRRAGSPPRFKQKGRGSRGLTTHTSSATFSTTFSSPHPPQVCYFSKSFSFGRIGRLCRCRSGNCRSNFSGALDNRIDFMLISFHFAKWGVCQS